MLSALSFWFANKILVGSSNVLQFISGFYIAVTNSMLDYSAYKTLTYGEASSSAVAFYFNLKKGFQRIILHVSEELICFTFQKVWLKY